MFGKRSLFNHPLLRVAVIFLLGQSFIAQAVPPAWWSQGNPPVVDPNASPDNHGMANIGQAKWMAKRAVEALRVASPTIADRVEADLVGSGKPIANWNAPASNEEREAQHAPLLLGQLKAISAPFYERIHEAAPDWLETERIANQMPDTGTFYPWTASADDDANRSPAAIGQLKAVFSLHFETLATAINPDKDGDGLNDQWEKDHGLDSTDNGSVNPSNGASGDPDGDGASNRDEEKAGTDPQNSEDFPLQTLQTSRFCSGTGNILPDPEISCFLISHANWNPLEGSTISNEAFDLLKINQALDAMPFPQSPGADLTYFFPANGLHGVSAYGHYYLSHDSVNANVYIAHHRVWIKAPSKPTIQEFQFLRIEENGLVGAEPTSKNVEVITLSIPANQKVSAPFDLKPKPVAQASNDNQAVISIIPIQVLELAPRTKDEDGNEIAGSEKPNVGSPLTPFVEVDPNVNKIAHRELKVLIGSALKDKKVTWTLEALPGAIPANIRGDWDDSPTHKDRFEASTVYDPSRFRRVSQTIGETKVGSDGNTAIRVNVPPIGFNQVRIKIQIEGIATPINLIDMEVPGVVIIDPGHGGQDSGAVGAGGVQEKDLALAYSLSLRQELIDKFTHEKQGLQIVMTRRTTEAFPSLTARPQRARDTGADVLVSIHFNSGAATARGTETFVERTADEASESNPGDNKNVDEDLTLATVLNTTTLNAVTTSDAGALNRGVKREGKAVTRDGASYNGNTQDYHPVKACLLEVEFLSNATALESIKLSNASGVAIKDAFAENASNDIFTHLRNQQ